MAYHLECVALTASRAGYGAGREGRWPGNAGGGPHGRAKEEGGQFARHGCLVDVAVGEPCRCANWNRWDGREWEIQASKLAIANVVVYRELLAKCAAMIGYPVYLRVLPPGEVSWMAPPAHLGRLSHFNML